MAGANYSLLVADDEEEIVHSVTTELNQIARRFKDKVQVYPALSGIDALKILSQHRIDAVILDYHFKMGMSGDEIIDKIKDPFGNMLIILMSGRDKSELDDIIIKRHKHFGSRFKFLRKPFEFLEIQDKYLEIEDFFSRLPYPFPIAYAQDSLLNSSTAQGKITAMKDLVETVVKYSVAILMADIHRMDVIDEITIGINWKQNLTLGDWLEWLSDLLKLLRSKQELLFMPELFQLFDQKYSGGYLNLMHKFKDKVRDTELDSGYVKEENWYALLANEYVKPLNSLFRDCSFTARYTLLMPEKIDFGEDGLFEYEARILMGNETKFGLTSFQTPHRLRLNEIYIFDATGHHISVSPFLKYSICTQCSLNRLYLLDRIESNQLVYNAFCNHQFKSGDGKIIFDERFAGLNLNTTDITDSIFQTEQVLNELYEIEETVGDTLHSRVVRALDKNLRRPVAIKSLHLDQEAIDKATEQRLLREAQILATLNHPNIGEVYHIIPNPLRIVMQWIEGSPLQDILDRGGQFSVTDVVKIGITLADALNHAHKREVIHRDIKPNNIILTEDGEPVLIDFNIARAGGHQTISLGEYVGTRPYSAPEQFHNREVGPPADLFALGVVLYELLTQQRPYKWGNDPSLYGGQFPKLDQFKMPDSLYQILCSLLHQQPDQRPTAVKLCAQLKNCQRLLQAHHSQ